jgi:hypothetical protein
VSRARSACDVLSLTRSKRKVDREGFDSKLLMFNVLTV